jgi:hypothetical protein
MTTVEIENSKPTRRRRRRKDAARYVRETYGVPCTEEYLAKLAVKGGGPLFEYWGRFPMYDDPDLDLWVESRRSKKVHSTSGLGRDSDPLVEQSGDRLSATLITTEKTAQDGETVARLALPRRRRGRQTPESETEYQAQRAAFCRLILEIRSTMDFGVGSRGWCYILEQHGLTKGDFSDAQKLITDCRRPGELPFDICAEDDSRETVGLQGDLDDPDVDSEAQAWVDYVRDSAAETYTPFGFWDDLDVYVEAAVEKLDLRNLFEPVCREFFVPITNTKGWSDLNSRAAMMRRFAEHEAAGRRCVLLLCGDHDPGGLAITGTMRKNLDDLATAVGWSPNNLVISPDLASTLISSIGSG